MSTTFTTKEDVNTYLRKQDVTRPISKICAGIPKIVAKENPALFDEICEMIESADVQVSRYGRQFFCRMYGKGFTEIGYNASRVPKAYAFACILKQKLPE